MSRDNYFLPTFQMAHLLRSPLLPKLLLVVLIFCVCMQVGFSKKQSSRRSNTDRYRSLYVSRNQIKRFANHRNSRTIFRLTRFKSRITTGNDNFYPTPRGITRYAITGRSYSKSRGYCYSMILGKSQTKCYATAKFGDPCCRTKMSLVVPLTVESANGKSYKVKHSSNNGFSQWIHLGECVSYDETSSLTAYHQYSAVLTTLLFIEFVL